MLKNKVMLDEQKLTKKYKVNVPRIIRAWKKGYSDVEISEALYVDLGTLNQLRYDIETEYLKSRYNRWLS